MKTGKLFAFLLFFIQLPVAHIIASGNISFADESIIVHTDRTVYISGEDLFFKLYVIDQNTHKLSTISKIAYMVLRDVAGKPVANICMKVQDGTAYGNIYLYDTLATGPYQLVAFTNWMKNRGESSFFYKELFIANLFDKELNFNLIPRAQEPDSNRINKPENSRLLITTDKKEYLRNEKIKLKIELEKSDENESANLSVSVHETSPVNELGLSVATDETLVNSISLKDNSASEITDYLPEIKGWIVNGRVMDQVTGKGAYGCKVMLSAMDTVVNLQYADCDTAGLFRFQLSDYYIGKDFIMSVMNNPAWKQPRIETEDNFKLNTGFKPALLWANPAMKAFIQKSQDIVYIQKNYGLQPEISVKQEPLSKLKIPRIYYLPDCKVYPADYVPLPDFIEISRELLPGVKMRKQNDGYSLALLDVKHQGFFHKNPAIFLNGIMINNAGQLISLGTEKIERIEVVNSQIICGNFFFEGGILAVFTNEKEIQNLRLSQDAFHSKIEPFLPSASMKTPQHLVKDIKNSPCFRQLIYWNPDVAVSVAEKREIEFYASEHTGNFSITITGIGSNGETISSTKGIIVR